MTFHAARRATGSKPVVGSSRKTRSGSPTSARPTSRRRRWPPDRRPTRSSAFSSRPTSSIVSATGRGLRVVRRPQRERLAHGQLGLRLALLQDDPDPRAPGAVAVLGIDAEHAHVAAVALAKALEDLDRRRLARPVGAEEGEDLAALHAQRQAAHGLDVAVGLAQPVDLDRGLGADIAGTADYGVDERLGPREVDRLAGRLRLAHDVRQRAHVGACRPPR